MSIEEKWQRLNQSAVVLTGSVLICGVGAVASLALGEAPWRVSVAGGLAVVAIANAFALARKRRSGEPGPVKHRSGRLTRR